MRDQILAWRSKITKVIIRPCGLWELMRHPDCPAQRRVSSRHREGVTSPLFRSSSGCAEIAQSLRFFLSYANLGARVDGFTIVHKSASVLTVFQTPGFRATVLHGDCPTLHRERLDGCSDPVSALSSESDWTGNRFKSEP